MSSVIYHIWSFKSMVQVFHYIQRQKDKIKERKKKYNNNNKKKINNNTKNKNRFGAKRE